MDEIIGNVRANVTHEPNPAYMKAFRANVQATLETYASSQPADKQPMLNREYENFCSALNHITYISMAALVRAVNENVLLIKDIDEEVCFIVPDSSSYQKSDMWITLVAALKMVPTLAASMQCAEDVAALAALHCSSCVLFDDCIYSGAQMSASLRQARDALAKAGAPTTVYCVPAFWHVNDSQVTKADIYTPVHDAVVKRSAQLATAKTYLSSNMWNVQRGQRLTYLQTKQPDELSFPPLSMENRSQPI
jgi:hypothetical protein